MNPDVSSAVTELLRRGILSPDRARLPARVARGELISVYLELRLLFYLGVLLAAAGAGMLAKENLHLLGPLGIATMLGAGALACLAWVARVAPPFSWNRTETPSIAFDYILLLGVLLLGVELGFVEVQFTALGRNWPWHLLLMSLLTGALAFRYDSRAVFSLALSTFAAWRGLSVSFWERPIWLAAEETVRLNAIGCGLLFVCLAYCLSRTDRKAHFAPVGAHLGWILFLGALVSGAFAAAVKGVVYALLLLGSGGALAAHAWRRRRLEFFAYGVVAVYIATTHLVLEMVSDDLVATLWFTASAAALIVALKKMHGKQERL